MNVKRLSLLCLVALSAVLYGCSASKIQVGPADNGAAVKLKQGQSLIITLASSPTTGYSWQPVLDPVFLAQTGEAKFEAESSLIGAGGAETFEFEALEPGTTTLTLNYMRPWEEDVEPEEIFQITVVIEG
ncbi:MAG: protease inhibitor I42 family protein [Anaerolineales bacterium]|nr:protease inhibitor I42 family protein [Anaerolineales bacterium]